MLALLSLETSWISSSIWSLSCVGTFPHCVVPLTHDAAPPTVLIDPPYGDVVFSP